MSRTQIFKWHKRFEKGREEVEDNYKTRRPSTTRTGENITRVKQLVRSDRMLTVRMISDELSLNREKSADNLAARSGDAKGLCQNGFHDFVGRPEAELSQIL